MRYCAIFEIFDQKRFASLNIVIKRKNKKKQKENKKRLENRE